MPSDHRPTYVLPGRTAQMLGAAVEIASSSDRPTVSCAGARTCERVRAYARLFGRTR